MKIFIPLIFLANFLFAQENSDSLIIRKIYSYHLTESKSYDNLHSLCKNIGARLSGSKQAEKAVAWAKQAMLQAGADTAYLVPCMVPHWVRGAKEKCYVTGDSKNKLESFAVCALGSSVATPTAGITTKVIEVTSFEELEKLGTEKIKGNIVFYNVSFDKTFIHTGSAYGKAVKYRSGASMAAFAISVTGAKRLNALLAQNKNFELYLYSDCKTLPDEPSYSVVGEIRGNEIPNEVIVVGGHLDSWDLGEGAHDDGAGVVQSIEVINAFKKLGIKNKRTIRAIAFMNEENGTRGGKSYAAMAAKENKKHIAALESDMGGFTPKAIGIEAKKDTLLYYKKWQPLFEPYFVFIKQGYGGTDIGELIPLGVPQFSLEPDSQRYFDIHHTADDTFEKVNERELELGAATITSFIYLLDKYGAYKK